MYSLLLSLAAAAAAFGLTVLFLPAYAAILPAILAFVATMVVVTWQLSKRIQPEIEKVMGMLQARQVKEARDHLEGLKTKWSPWQPFLAGQLDAQIGMIDYLQMKWDDALPRLEAGKWRNWQALVCIGAIHHRRGRDDQAWAAFDDAAKAAPKEPMVYVVHATLRTRKGQREDALKVLGRGVEQIPRNQLLTRLKSDVANKKKIDVRSFPETWYQFFPEDLMKHMNMRGQRQGPMPGMGFPQPRVSKKMRRG